MSDSETSRQASKQGARGVLSKSHALQDALGGSLDTEIVDLYEVAAILQPFHPEYSVAELARQVAEIAVESGCRYLVWEPPQG